MCTYLPLVVQGNGEQRRRRKETELQRDESSLGSNGFAHEARDQEMAALDSSNSRIGHGRYRARPNDDHKDSCLPGKGVKRSKNAEEKSAGFVNRMCQITLEAFWTQSLIVEEGFDRTDSMLEGLGAGWTASFLAKVYPRLSRYLIREFLKAITGLSIVVILALFVAFRAKIFVKGSGGTAHPGSAECTTGRTPDNDCDYAWKLGRADELDPSPRANERKRKEVRYETIH